VNFLKCVGESAVDFQQLARFHEVYWRKTSGLSPLAKVLVGESLIGEIRESHFFAYIKPNLQMLLVDKFWFELSQLSFETNSSNCRDAPAQTDWILSPTGTQSTSHDWNWCITK
jgi:hypothetical protein